MWTAPASAARVLVANLTGASGWSGGELVVFA